MHHEFALVKALETADNHQILLHALYLGVYMPAQQGRQHLIIHDLMEQNPQVMLADMLPEEPCC